MKISFIIPAYNEERYIAACIASILQQTQKAPCAVEIVVVNNASTDKTRQAAALFSGVRVVDEPRKGLLFARQAGFLASTGDLIAQVDADSILPEGWIETVFKKFSNNPKLAAMGGPVIYYDLPLRSNVLVRLYYYAAYLIVIFNKLFFRKGLFLQGGNMVMRKAALQQIGGYNTGISFYGEDTDIALRLRTAGKVVFTFALEAYTSGRRLKAEGFAKMGWKYPVNYFWTVFFKRPFHQEYSDVRPAEPALGFRTTAAALNRAMVWGKMLTFTLMAGIAGVGLYVNVQITKMPQPKMLAIQTSKSYAVRKFGARVMQINYEVNRLKRIDPD